MTWVLEISSTFYKLDGPVYPHFVSRHERPPLRTKTPEMHTDVPSYKPTPMTEPNTTY